MTGEEYKTAETERIGNLDESEAKAELTQRAIRGERERNGFLAGMLVGAAIVGAIWAAAACFL